MSKPGQTRLKKTGRKREATKGSDISAAYRRAEALSQRLSMASDDLAVEAVEELRVTLEELLVVDEELREQNEELIAARHQLEAERLKYEELFESAPDGYLVTDAHGAITKANRAAAQLLNVSRNFLISKPLFSYVARVDQLSFMTELNRLAAEEHLETRNLDFRLRPRSKADSFAASIRVSPIRNKEGELIELRWSIRDISRLKNWAEEIQQFNAELEERVSRRTAELEQVNAFKDELLEREQTARANAEAANRSKDDFLAIVSHELRTPLNAILGWAQLLRRDTDDKAQRLHAAEIIERSARAQARLINDILDVSRVVSGGLPLDKRPVTLEKVIEAAVDSARPGVDAKGITLNTRLSASGAIVIGDSTRLQQIVANLLSNSTKFTKRGGSVDIELAQIGDDVRITVSDSGRGISEEFLPHVFDRFSQADSQFTRQQGGMGLGLAIVKILVELHGGSVSAASEGEDKGSTFTVFLPAAPRGVAVNEAPPGDTELEKSAASVSLLASVWVAVVDDDFDAREMMRAVLEGAGARVTTCASFDEALSLFEERATTSLSARLPEVLVADIAMPGHDGFDLIRAIRRLGSYRGGGIPAIALTAYTDDETRIKALSEGYQVHLTKPLNLAELVTTIARLTSN